MPCRRSLASCCLHVPMPLFGSLMLIGAVAFRPTQARTRRSMPTSVVPWW